MRLKSRDFLTAERRAGEAGYRLTEAGHRDLTTGDRRIFRPATATAADGWVLAVFSVPETHRHLRHQLRTELSWLGFGTVSPGVWIAPRPLADPTRALLTDAGLDGYVTWFAAQHLTEIDVAHGGTWTRCGPSTRHSWLEHRPGGGGVRRGGHRRSGVRRLPAVDRRLAPVPPARPGAARATVTGRLAGPVACELFDGLRATWSEPGLRYVRAVTGG